jgi:hypothetical protein
MLIRRKHWYPVDACHRCKGIGSELKKLNKYIYYLIVKFYMFYNVFFYFQLFLGFWLSSALLPGDLLPGVLLPGVLLPGYL